MKRLVATVLVLMMIFGLVNALADGWICPKCGSTATGSFCPKCGKKKPANIETETSVTAKTEPSATIEPITTSIPDEETAGVTTAATGEEPAEENTETQTEPTVETAMYDFSPYGYGNTAVFVVPADVLYDYGSSYVGKVVVTAIQINDKESKSLKANTANNDTYSFSVVAEFSEASEISSVKENQTVIVIGTVDEMGTISLFGANKTVNLSDCHIVTSGITVAEIEDSHGKALQSAENARVEQQTQAANALAKEKQDYMEKCEKVKYSDVERNPGQYKGKYIQATGKVIQVSEGWFNTVTLRVQQKGGDVWYVTYTRSDDEPRILENDNLTFYGKCTGVETYRTVLGGSVTIPAMEAKYYK